MYTDPKYYDPAQYKIVKEEQPDGSEIEIIYRKGKPGRDRDELAALRAEGKDVLWFNFCAKPNPRTYEAEPGIICHQDLATRLRDGTTIYSDVYLPKDSGPVPLIVSWGPFGKRPSEGMEEWKLMGVPPQTVSTMAKFESADPAYWCRMGYGVANVDPRGVGNSEGDISMFGIQDGRDGYDYIEWAARQSWCSGKVGMFGNSGVCMVQWRIAAEQPPHLACIAAWEGSGDIYRESVAVGGVTSPEFNESIINTLASKGYVEDFTAMLKEHPFVDDYWKSKIPRWKNIKIPAYVSAGWCHFHLHGAMEGFRKIRSPKKWLRAHREFEWPDSYNPENLAELTRFYDRYLKDVRNGWEFTPKVRLDVMDGYDFDYASKRVENEFPLKRTEYKKLYLNAADASMASENPAGKAEVVYDPEKESVVFDYKFTEDTEVTGYMKLRLYCECRGHDDMDLFVWVKKLGLDGQYLPVHCMKEAYRGAWGYCRVSRRELDEKASTDFQPVQAHQRDLKLSAGEIVPVDVEIWPHSRFFHKGESLRVEITGRFVVTDWYEDAKMGFSTANGEGKHVLHTGGEYESFLQIPAVPPKYQVSDYIYRG